MPPTFLAASAFSPDGKRAVYVEDLSSATDEVMRWRSRFYIWDAKHKSWPRELDVDGKNIWTLALSADGGKALVTGQLGVGKDKEDRAYLSLWDVNANKELHSIVTKEAQPFQSAALGPDGTTAITSGRLKRWDLKATKELASYGGKDHPNVSAVEFLPGGKQFLAGCWRTGAIDLWDVNTTDKPVRTFQIQGGKNFFSHLAVAANGKRFVSVEFPLHVTLWNIDTGKAIATLPSDKRTVEEDVLNVALADDGKTVLCTWGHETPAADDFQCARLIAWDAAANKIVWSHPVGYRGRPPMLVQGDKLLIGGGPNLLDTWSIKDGKLLESRGGHYGPVNVVAVLPNGDLLSAGQEGVLMTWRNGHVVRKQPAHTGAITALALSRDRKLRLTAGADQIVKLWAADKAKSLHEFKGHTGTLTAIEFSGDGRWAASGSADRSVKTWDLATGKEIVTLAGHSEGVNAIAISADGLWLASASGDATIKLWPIKAGNLDPDREAITLDQHKKAVTCLAFSPDGKMLVSGSQDQTLKVWDWAGGKLTRTIAGHKNWVTSVRFADAKSILTTSDDLSVCRWNVATGHETGRVDFGAVGDCPRCLALAGPDRFVVGTASWVIFEFAMK